MNMLKFIFFNIIATLLRLFPLPSRTGLISIGNPDRSSPVFLTGNYMLTLLRVKRAIRGNAYLLVANSRGINVWCAATGGHLTDHDVISVLKTSGIEKLVDHRDVILPQLAGTGVDATTVKKKAGWKIIWGPVYAKDIPSFVKNKLQKTPEMREVRFPLIQRIEMAVAWAFPISLISTLLLMIFWQEAVIPTILLVWGLSFLIYLTFPAYSRWLSPGKKRIGFIIFDFGRGGFQIILWMILILGLIILSVLSGDFSWRFIISWGLMITIISVILSMDLLGSTPVYKSGLHEDRLLTVILDEQRCKGIASCEGVCPRNCFDVDRARHSATMPRAERCVQCGACIVQCPLDALCFRSPKGETIPAETIRKYKLNLMGKRIESKGKQ
jgi:NAD-dependent dihydropyrimidine dehydrogenase PreA subunit